LPPHAKVHGFIFAPTFQATIQLTWDRVITGLEATLRQWATRHMLTFAARKLALETFTLSRLWYFAAVALALPCPALQRINTALGNFLWAGRLERLSLDEPLDKVASASPA
jgi:hypothetical protein